MSAEYTPTTEVVKDACTFPRQRLGEPRDMTPEAFDRWHAAEIAAAEKRGAVEALRDAAVSLNEIDPGRDAVFWTGDWYESVPDWLADRADQLDKES